MLKYDGPVAAGRDEVVQHRRHPVRVVLGGGEVGGQPGQLPLQRTVRRVVGRGRGGGRPGLRLLGGKQHITLFSYPTSILNITKQQIACQVTKVNGTVEP